MLPGSIYNYDLLYDKNYYGERLNKNYFSDRQLKYRIIRNGYIFISNPNDGFFDSGVFDSKGDYIEGTSLHNEPESQKIFKLSDNELKTSRHISSTVIYAGLFFGLWGHFITDCIKKLWFLKSKDYIEKFSDCPIVYIPMGGFKLKGNHKRFLEILGIDCSRLAPVTELTHYDSVIVPDESFFCSDECIFFTDEYKAMIDSVRDFAVSHRMPSNIKKVYYSHSRFGNGQTFGEDKLERYFASKGYEIIYPEKLSLDEQLNILINCGSFASTIGSCSHNIIFLRDNTEVILIPRADYLTGYQETINQLHSLRISYVDSSFSIFVEKFAWRGPFLYFVSSNLRKYFHDEDTSDIIDVSDFMHYLKANPPADNIDSYRYYSIIAAKYFSQLFTLKRDKTLKEKLKKITLLRKAVRAVRKILSFIR